MDGTFKLEIELGNDDMQTSDHIAEALRNVADQLDRGAPGGRIVDENGNTVGRYEVES
jgi:hypothetical protein